MALCLTRVCVLLPSSCVSSAKSSHPKKSGCATKNASSTSTLHPRGAKDADAAAPNGRKDARTNRKAEPPTSSVQKASETSGRPAEPKPSPRLPQGISTSFNEKEGAQGASGPESSPKSSAVRDGGAPEPQRGAPDGNNATGDTLCTRGESECSFGGERPGRTQGEGEEEQRKSKEEESCDESSPR